MPSAIRKSELCIAAAVVIGGLCWLMLDARTRIAAQQPPEVVSKLESTRPTPADHENTWTTWLAMTHGWDDQHRLPDGTWVDLLTETHAVEVEWCTADETHKIYEAVGQALYYAAATGKRPKIILLFDGSPAAERAYMRCLVACVRAGVELETIDVREGH